MNVFGDSALAAVIHSFACLETTRALKQVSTFWRRVLTTQLCHALTPLRPIATLERSIRLPHSTNHHMTISNAGDIYFTLSNSGFINRRSPDGVTCTLTILDNRDLFAGALAFDEANQRLFVLCRIANRPHHACVAVYPLTSGVPLLYWFLEDDRKYEFPLTNAEYSCIAYDEKNRELFVPAEADVLTIECSSGQVINQWHIADGDLASHRIRGVCVAHLPHLENNQTILLLSYVSYRPVAMCLCACVCMCEILS